MVIITLVGGGGDEEGSGNDYECLWKKMLEKMMISPPLGTLWVKAKKNEEMVVEQMYKQTREDHGASS